MSALPVQPLFKHRRAAGEALARGLDHLRGRADVLVLGLPRGGVSVARSVADALHAPLDVIVARRLGVPGLPEVALGAIVEGWHGIVEDSVRWYIGVPKRVVNEIARTEREELERRTRLYRAGQPLPDVRGRTVVLVDDGLATGATLRAAAIAVRARKPARIVAAVPVASPAHVGDVRAIVDELVTIATPDPFEMVSSSYAEFGEVSDAQVLSLLRRLPVAVAGRAPTGTGTAAERHVFIPIPSRQRGAAINGDLGLPNADDARGLVILAHGGGSSRQSYRNRYLAGRLRMAGWATLRVDLVLESEQAADVADGSLRFDVSLIATRLQAATEWATATGMPGGHRMVLFGASTGAAAAMVVAARRPAVVAGVISRGGRIDLAGDALRDVTAPTLLIVGGADPATIRFNRDALRHLHGRTRLTVIRGAGHTFDEPGSLGQVGERTVRWLASLTAAGQPAWLRTIWEMLGRDRS
jgi:putative phosphoribosyl transferase